MRRVEQEVEREAKRQIVRHEMKAKLFVEEIVRQRKRSTAPPPLVRPSRPLEWDLDVGFDPYITRSRAARIGHSIQNAINDRRYAPRPPRLRDHPKPGGGTRPVFVYQVADGAVSKMLFESALRKNLPMMSARSYAYRKDVSTQDAVRYVKSELVGRSRVFVAEYDFSKYFETISHKHVTRLLDAHFYLTDSERDAIKSFLRAGAHPAASYTLAPAPERRRGIPQGTSISLFLANVAAWELDRELERLGVGFARYADDTLIWSSDYGRICAAADVLHEQAQIIGVAVSEKKSRGIHLLVPEEAPAELAPTLCVDYLGYRIRTDGVHLKPETIEKMKEKLVHLIFTTLLSEPFAGSQHPSRLAPNVDKDYVTLIARIRRHLYGDLSERELRRYQRQGAPLRRFKGLMAAYPLLDDTEELRDLDSWLLDRLWLAVRRRGLALDPTGLMNLPPPHGLSREALKRLSVMSMKTKTRIDLTVPSFRRIANVVY